MNWYSTKGKSALVKMLMTEHHFSKRKSEKAVNAVFDCMVRALWHGEPRRRTRHFRFGYHRCLSRRVREMRGPVLHEVLAMRVSARPRRSRGNSRKGSGCRQPIAGLPGEWRAVEVSLLTPKAPRPSLNGLLPPPPRWSVAITALARLDQATLRGNLAVP
jgi:nucleoid DNA-binding protein